MAHKAGKAAVGGRRGISSIWAHQRKKSGQSVARSGRPRFEPLRPEHMPAGFGISLDAYRRGGTVQFLDQGPDGLAYQPMRGFESTYANIVDYIVRMTHRIWEKQDVGYVYDTYSDDCKVLTDFGLLYGRDRIVADTVLMTNAFPNIRVVSDEIIWAGDEDVGFHCSHRMKIAGTNTGYSRFGPPTGKSVKVWCISNFVAEGNEIYQGYVHCDTASMVEQLGMDVMETARRFAADDTVLSTPYCIRARDHGRAGGKERPPVLGIPSTPEEAISTFANAAFHMIWNRRNFGSIDRIYASNVVHVGTTNRILHGTAPLRSFVMSVVAMFPDLSFAIDDLYWMGNPREGYLISVRWSAFGTHKGPGPYGEPTGKDVQFQGITHWEVENGRVRNEWMLFNEFAVLMQLSR